MRFRALVYLALTGAASSCVGGTADPGSVAARLGIEVDPPGATPSGAPLNPQPVVQVQDVGGNPVPVRGLLVTAGLGAGGGTLVGQAAVRTDASGRAVFTDLGIGGPVATRVLRFTAPGLASATSRPVAVEPGAPASATHDAGNNQTVAAGTPVPIAPAVKVVDGFGNPVANLAVTFTVEGGGGSITGNNPSTGPDGVAAVTQWTLGPQVGLNTLKAELAGLASTPTFTATGVVGPVATLTVVEGDGQNATIGALVATAPAVRVTDAFDNPIAGLTITFAVASGGGVITGGTPTSDPGGVARLGQWRLGLIPGDNSLTASRTGVPSATFTATGVDFSVTLIAPGQAHSCAVSSAAGWCWGDNTLGQLGTGGLASDSVPGAVTGALALTQVVAGQGHSCGVTAAGAAHCWGLNLSGQLGDGTGVNRTGPVAVVGGNSFSALAAGGLHTCGLRTDGVILCWGEGGSGQLGTGGLLDLAAPTPVFGGLTFTGLTAGAAHTCAIATGGTAYCWGSNGNGRLGDGTTTSRTVPTAVPGGPFASIAAGGAHTCVVDGGGAGFCWGLGSSGQLGTGSTAQQTTPIAVSGGLTFTQISTGAAHSCGVTDAGAAYCWGSNGFGRLGDGTTINRTNPTAVVAALTWSALAAGGEFTCARSAAGSAICWGRNTEGQLGDGSTTGRPLPTGVKRP